MDLLENKNLDKEIDRHPWEMARLFAVKHIFKDVLSNLDKKKYIEVMDVGSGDAFVINNFTQEFDVLNCSAIDIYYSPEQLNQLRKKYKDVDFYNDYKSVSDNLDTVNALFFFDVIEHIPDDYKFMEGLLQESFVKKGTHFIITVPAFQSLFSNHDVFLKHYRRYTRKNLTKLVRHYNLEVLQSGYFFNSLIPLRIIVKIKEKLFKEKVQDSNLSISTRNKTFDKIITGVLKLDFLILRTLSRIGIQIPGLSVYVVCKKN